MQEVSFGSSEVDHARQLVELEASTGLSGIADYGSDSDSDVGGNGGAMATDT